MIASSSYVHLFYFVLLSFVFYPLNTLFWIWKGLQRPFSSYLVCGFLTDFLASGITCKHITRNLTCSTYSLFFLTLAQHSHLRLSLLWQPVWTHFSGSDIRALTDSFLLSCHALKPWMVPLPIKSQGPARQRGTEKHLSLPGLRADIQSQ